MKSICCSIIIAFVTLFAIIGTQSITSNGEPESSIVQTRYQLAKDDASVQQQAVAPYKDPNRWMINILKELFSDIDWQTIENARVQIEKFIRQVDRMLGSFRSILLKATGSTSSAPRETRANSNTAWWYWNKPTASSGSDPNSVKEMLERVACYVGYFRLMNLSNEALAELDASKVITNLFNADRRNGSAWTWFG